MKPLVSILIPAFNAEEWIADTLRSAVGQSWPNKEIVVVDDGSSDRTLEIAQRFESNSVRIFTKENQGAAATRNKAFALSRGDYIQWLDADDLLAPDKIAKQMEVLGGSPDKRKLLSGSWGRFMHRYYRTRFVPTALWCDLTPVEWLVRKMSQNLYMQTATWLASRELTEGTGLWDTRLLGDDDGEYFCRALLASDGVRFVSESKVYYRASGTTSLSYIGSSDKKRDAQWCSMQLHVKYLRSLEESERTHQACVKYLQNWLIFFYPERMDLVKQAENLAQSLGGQLRPPHLPWKYSWIASTLGWPVAKHVQRILPSIRWFLQGAWDKTLFQLEHRGPIDPSRV